MRFTTLFSLAVALLAACGDDPQHFVDAGPIDAAMLDGQSGGCSDAAGLPVYLDRAGGTFTGGADDPGSNHSSLITGTATVLPYGSADAAWSEVVACVKQTLAPFHLRVTDVDPGAVDQLEVVFAAGSSADVIGVTGVRQASPETCSISRDSLHFVFPDELAAPSPSLACKLAVQAIGHAAALDFTPDCSDAMAFGLDATGCTGGGFTDADLACGTTEPMPCACNGDTNARNSFLTIRLAYGACP